SGAIGKAPGPIPVSHFVARRSDHAPESPGRRNAGEIAPVGRRDRDRGCRSLSAALIMADSCTFGLRSNKTAQKILSGIAVAGIWLTSVTPVRTAASPPPAALKTFLESESFG